MVLLIWLMLLRLLLLPLDLRVWLVLLLLLRSLGACASQQW